MIILLMECTFEFDEFLELNLVKKRKEFQKSFK